MMFCIGFVGCCIIYVVIEMYFYKQHISKLTEIQKEFLEIGEQLKDLENEIKELENKIKGDN